MDSATDMTLPQEDEESRGKDAQLRGILVQLDQGKLLGKGGVDWALKEINLLFAPYTKAKCLEARIDELNKVLENENFHKDDWGVDCIYRSPIEDRRAELVALKQSKESKK